MTDTGPLTQALITADDQIESLRAEIERLWAALQDIVRLGGAEDTLSAIARRALEPKP